MAKWYWEEENEFLWEKFFPLYQEIYVNFFGIELGPPWRDRLIQAVRSRLRATVRCWQKRFCVVSHIYRAIVEPTRIQFSAIQIACRESSGLYIIIILLCTWKRFIAINIFRNVMNRIREGTGESIWMWRVGTRVILKSILRKWVVTIWTWFIKIRPGTNGRLLRTQ